MVLKKLNLGVIRIRISGIKLNHFNSISEFGYATKSLPIPWTKPGTSPTLIFKIEISKRKCLRTK